MGDQPLNVLHIAHSPLTGVWSVIKSLTPWQQRQGLRVGLGILVAKGWGENYRRELAELEVGGIQVFRGYSPNVFLTAAFLAHRVLNPVPHWANEFVWAHPDAATVVHFHDAWLSGVYLPLRLSGLPVYTLATFHGITGARKLRQQALRRRIHAGWAQRLVRFGAALSAVDQESTQVAQELFGLAPELFTVIPNGVEAFAGGIGCPRLRGECDALTVGHVASLSEGKGWRFTAQAVETLHDAGLSVRLLVAGAGEESADAAEWCAARSVYATFLGHVDQPRQTVFPHLDVLVNPSLSEGLPMSLLEAFAAGVPVLATPVGGVPQALSDGVNGYFIERIPGVISERLRWLIDDRILHQRLSQNALATFQQRYTLDMVGKAYLALYDKIRNG